MEDAAMMEQGVGESSSPPKEPSGRYDIKPEIYARLIEAGNDEAVSDPSFSEALDAHFARLPTSCGLDLKIEKAEDVLLHRKILTEAKDPEKRPVFSVRFSKGLRPEIPENMYPKLLELIQRCWETSPATRPFFGEIKLELEELLRKVKGIGETSSEGEDVSKQA